MMRVVLLVAAVMCRYMALLIGFGWIEVSPGKTLLLTMAWASWALALHIAAGLPVVGRFDARYGGRR